jgi:hypothetical protein
LFAVLSGNHGGLWKTARTTETTRSQVPSGNRQIGLGASTMRRVNAHLGSIVRVTFEKRTVPFTVVAQISFPVLEAPASSHPAAPDRSGDATGAVAMSVRCANGKQATTWQREEEGRQEPQGEAGRQERKEDRQSKHRQKLDK